MFRRGGKIVLHSSVDRWKYRDRTVGNESMITRLMETQSGARVVKGSERDHATRRDSSKNRVTRKSMLVKRAHGRTAWKTSGWNATKRSELIRVIAASDHWRPIPLLVKTERAPRLFAFSLIANSYVSLRTYLIFCRNIHLWIFMCKILVSFLSQIFVASLFNRHF